MSKFLFYTGSLLLGLFSAGLFVFGFLRLAADPGTLEAVKQASEKYKEGERSESVAGRKAAFNQALQGYLKAEKAAHPSFGNGKLYYNIGNGYYQLGEYPLAIYYYKRARALMPREVAVQQNLNAALGKLDLPPEAPPTTLDALMAFHQRLSLPERLAVLGLILLALSAILSFYIWFPGPWVGFLATMAGVAAMIFLGSVLYTRFLAPQQGVLLHATPLYRDAGTQYSQVTDKPLAPGQTVDVLDQRQEGQWLKILPPTGTPGYVPQQAIRLL